jgi:predicted transcriptional regulator
MRSTIGRLASSPVVTVETDSLVREGLALMCAKNVSSLIVLSGTEPVGILTERDVVFAANWMQGQSDLRVGQVMNKQVRTVNRDLTVREVCEIFQACSLRHLVVVDHREQMTGVFTRTDLVQIMDKTVFSDVSDISGLMSPKVWHVVPSTPARYALSLMARHAISGVLVMDAMRPVGFFTEKNILGLITAGRDLADCSIAETTVSPVVETPTSTTPSQAIALMKNRSVRRLLVLDQLGEIAGVLTQTDLSRSLDCCKVKERLPGIGKIVAPAAQGSIRTCMK